VVHQLLHDVLRNVAVDEPGAEGVPEPVRRDPDRLAELVRDVQRSQPVLEGCR
jgi:hypothetical protein